MDLRFAVLLATDPKVKLAADEWREARRVYFTKGRRLSDHAAWADTRHRYTIVIDTALYNPQKMFPILEEEWNADGKYRY